MIILALLASVLLAAGTPSSGADHSLVIKNKVPSFTAFYADATGKPLSESARWTLWKREYGIAAVPPTPQGDALARKQLDAAWPKYAALLPELPALTARAERDARTSFNAINALFETKGTPIDAQVVLYVGQFDDNAYTIPPSHKNRATLVMPVENRILAVATAHELTHAVNMQLAGVKNSFGAPLGETVFLEGLATRTTQRVLPGLPEGRYIETTSEPGWLARCYARRDAVLRGMLPMLAQSGPAVATRFTYGKGTTGMDREAYCAGWIVIGDLVAHGHTFAELARIPEPRMVQTVRDEIVALLK